MAHHTTPTSPEDYPADVRDELHQHAVSHDGEARTAEDVPDDAMPSSHFGATEDEPTPVTPPMAGPDNLTGGREQDVIDPTDEIPGG